MGRIEAICRSEGKGTAKQPVAHGTLQEGHGLVGDAHAGPWHRQISLLDSADIAHMRDRGAADLAPGAFGENLVTSGLDLASLGLGSRLQVGHRAEVSITQRGKVCHHRCAIFYQAGACIMPDRGLFARVVQGGDIHPGDPIAVIDRIAPEAFQVVALTISDKGDRGERVDTAGPAVARYLEDTLAAHVYAAEVLPDHQEQIAERLRHYADGHGIDLVVAVGGTGFAPRDVTPEAVRAVAERLTPGLDEAMRGASMRATPRAMLSRAVSAIRGQTLIVSLPGAPRAALENLAAIAPALPHGLEKLRGSMADCADGPQAPPPSEGEVRS